MTKAELYSQICTKRSFLCVGLDTDIKKIPAILSGADDPIFEFNKAIIDATAPYTVCYKPNVAFYEERGDGGWRALQRTVEYLKDRYPSIFVIADAKRGDIGNTSAMYARAFFDEMGVDAVTLSPYMGRDTVDPFLGRDGKWAVLLALTSNPSAADFELTECATGERLYEKVLRVSSSWGTSSDTMYVVGATQASALASIRKIVPSHFLLVPGVGAQGGSLAEVAQYGMNAQCGLLVNSSRGVIYASSGADFAQAAAREAEKLQLQMANLLANRL
ncbi:MAG: orotidine-5'-phosphate decarboxylase [Mucinivorans sp.]